MKKFSAIIFDLDGTLLDTLQDLAEAMNRALAKFNLPLHAVNDYKMLVGEGMLKLAERAVPTEHANLVPEVLTAFNADYQENWAVATAPYRGINELLAELTARQIRTAVLSNKPHRYIAGILAHFFSQHSFTEAHGQYPDKPRKPDPWGARQIADRLKLSASEILYAGDSCIDMQTAKAAPMFACGVSWGFREKDELQAAGADIIVDTPAEILRFF